MTEIPASTLAALKADILNAAAGWWCVSADVSHHDHTHADPNDPENIIAVIERHVTVTLESPPPPDGRGMTLIFMLEGRDGQPPARGKVYYRGNSLSFTDPWLLAQLDAKAGPVNQLYASELEARLSEAL